MPDAERDRSDTAAPHGTAEKGGEMGGAPYPSDMTMPDPRRGDRGGDFEGETDPMVRGEDAGKDTGATPPDVGSRPRA